MRPNPSNTEHHTTPTNVVKNSMVAIHKHITQMESDTPTIKHCVPEGPHQKGSKPNFPQRQLDLLDRTVGEEATVVSVTTSETI